MVVYSFRRDSNSTPYIIEELVKQADTMYHFVEQFNEFESKIEKDQCVEFFMCQMQINKRMCEMIDKLIEYEQNYAAQSIMLRGKAERKDKLNQLTDDIRTYMNNQNEALKNDVYEIKKVIRQIPILVTVCDDFVRLWHKFTCFKFDNYDHRHKYYFIKILGYADEQFINL